MAQQCAAPQFSHIGLSVPRPYAPLQAATKCSDALWGWWRLRMHHEQEWRTTRRPVVTTAWKSSATRCTAEALQPMFSSTLYSVSFPASSPRRSPHPCTSAISHDTGDAPLAGHTSTAAQSLSRPLLLMPSMQLVYVRQHDSLFTPGRRQGQLVCTTSVQSPHPRTKLKPLTAGSQG